MTPLHTNAPLLAELSHLFSIEALAAEWLGNDGEAERFWEISDELHARHVAAERKHVKVKFDPMDYARRLSTNGFVAGVIGQSVYIRRNDILWRVVGGDPKSPSLLAARDVKIVDVHWVYA